MRTWTCSEIYVSLFDVLLKGGVFHWMYMYNMHVVNHINFSFSNNLIICCNWLTSDGRTRHTISLEQGFTGFMQDNHIFEGNTVCGRFLIGLKYHSDWIYDGQLLFVFFTNMLSNSCTLFWFSLCNQEIRTLNYNMDFCFRHHHW